MTSQAERYIISALEQLASEAVQAGFNCAEYDETTDPAPMIEDALRAIKAALRERS